MKRDPGSYDRWLDERDRQIRISAWRVGDRFSSGPFSGVVTRIETTAYSSTAYSVKVDSWPHEVVIPAWMMNECTKLEAQ